VYVAEGTVKVCSFTEKKDAPDPDSENDGLSSVFVPETPSRRIVLPCARVTLGRKEMLIALLQSSTKQLSDIVFLDQYTPSVDPDIFSTRWKDVKTDTIGSTAVCAEDLFWTTKEKVLSDPLARVDPSVTVR
jgi:hypothetical protein